MPRFDVATINNIILACLVWLVVMLGLFYGSDQIYHNPDPLVPAYNIVGGEDKGAATTVKTSAVSAIKELSLAERLAKGNLQNGIRVFGECGICHTPVAHGPNRVGPNLWGVVGRPVGEMHNFGYSRAMRALKEQGRHWDYEMLDSYLLSPQKKVRGTAMSFIGIKNAQDRADLILYLRSLAEEPVALPSVPQVAPPASAEETPL